MKMIRTLFAAVLLLVASYGDVFSQASSVGAVPIQQSATNLGAATGLQSGSPAVASQTTLTIPASSGNYVYITTILIEACMDGTASASDVNKSWTTTNLLGLTLQTSVDSSTTITTNAGALLCDRVVLNFPNGLKSAAPGTAVTIVSPASNAKVSYPSLVAYYYAP